MKLLVLALSVLPLAVACSPTCLDLSAELPCQVHAHGQCVDDSSRDEQPVCACIAGYSDAWGDGACVDTEYADCCSCLEDFSCTDATAERCTENLENGGEVSVNTACTEDPARCGSYCAQLLSG